MSKRIIIIENCEDCPNSGPGFLKPERVCLKVFKKDGERFCPKDGTPDWCPLPAAPEHKYGVASWLIRQAQTTDEDVDFWRGYIRGWNECVETIPEEEED